ncbi:MAG TPA: hypothetical protein VMT24_06820 [Aggregatilineaceae bacterium]|jgi:hypothetical protein|nr:hypothetical protein [Aggregatilineaceae bacterium]
MANNGDVPEIPVETLAETENYTIWSAVEPDGETTYHVELGPVTAHFFPEEWKEFIEMIHAASQDMEPDEEETEVELDWGALFFFRDEWEEFLRLIDQVEA